MNTRTINSVPALPLKRARDYEILFENFELAFEKKQLTSIAKDWDNGMTINRLAIKYKKADIEMLLAIVYLSHKHRLKRKAVLKVG